MMTGFARRADGAVAKLSSVEEAVASAAELEGVTWIDVEDPTDSELQRVGEAFHLEPTTLEDALSGQQRPRIDEFEQYIVVIYYGLFGPAETDEVGPRKLTAFLGTNWLITVHGVPLRVVRDLHHRCTLRGDSLLGQGAAFLLYGLIDAIGDNLLHLVDQYEDRIEALEERSLGSDVDETVLSSTLPVRRELLELRQLAVSQREVVGQLARDPFDSIPDALEPRFAHVLDHLTKVVEQIDGLRERLNGVRDNYHTALTQRINAVIKTLTIFASVLLPLSLITGIYGMNLPVWPPGEHPASFWGVLAVMLVVAVVLLTYFRRKRWL
ncbi:MAG TPA: magnesium/cobalt transporter CorA [Phycisphaerae bacterium]|nr:magnesium/cobalt transporter CorA [Phycisphaerae bacterium]HNU45752.1 magnesium/cobalt transporter CorA [Phycisphaerae bacterium]